jgi:hypothetical protein
VDYLYWLHIRFPDGRLDCITDEFSAHTTDQVLSTAVELTIEIIWILEGATGIYQPLDRWVFGALKPKGHAKRRGFYAENYGRPCNRELLYGFYSNRGMNYPTRS